MLNTMDGDPDVETSSAHWLETPEGLPANANAGDDREDEDEREPPVDDEPSLGWAHTINQTAAAWQANNLGMMDLEEGVGPVRKARPASRTGDQVVYCAQSLR
jgi:hypothetical protein